ncbi:IF2 family translation initiation factor [Mycolicibacterium phlei]|jgi:hypothetical protein
MSLTAIPRAVLRLQYQVARIPLQLLDDRVVGRLSEEAPARLFFERSLGMLDATVGTALGDPVLRKQGMTLVDRSDALRRAARLDAAAEDNLKQSEAELEATREKAYRDQRAAFTETDRDKQQAREQAQQRKRAAVEDTEKRIVAEKKRADEVAAQRKKSVEATRNREEAQIEAAERVQTRAAAAKLDDAAGKRADAATARAQADTIEDLAETEKQKRQADR